MKRICLILVLGIVGCADDGGSSAKEESPRPDNEVTEPADASVTSNDSTETSATEDDNYEFKPLNLAGGSEGADTSDSKGGSSVLSGEANIRSVMEKLKPLQVMLGEWRGTTRKEFDGFKAVDSHEWIWDLRTDPERPALAVKSDKSPYLRQARLTWEPNKKQFLLSATDGAGVTHTYTGDYTDPVNEIIGPDDKPHRVFRLELTETPESAKTGGNESWQIAFRQQENNRYLLEVSKRRGTAQYRVHDIVSTQRHGTSFALSDDDYGEKTCIISEGLGTSTVSWKGKSYWVCCSGCRAAFEEDPEKWIARAEKRAAEKK